ncbi:MAG: lipid-A-disaccharide synthase N-terminal domain-containing protein [Sedimentisphaerales bacterium]|nr:lipid-A-disaccharide synthase N-terminal domain-containing protein [Sedimentisphaerales bacterium]
MFESFINELSQEPVWTSIGFVGQVTFGGRFVLQWIVSEYKKRSHVPVAFWFLSLIGSLILLVYSIHRNEPIFILGFSVNTLIYIRNLHLIFKHKQTGKITVIEQEED